MAMALTLKAKIATGQGLGEPQSKLQCACGRAQCLAWP